MGRVVGLTLARPRPLGDVLDLPLRAGRRDVPAAQPLDARLRRRALRLASLPGAAPRPRARRAARDELVRSPHRVRGRDDPRDRRRDGQPGPAHRRGRRRGQRRSRRPDAARLRGRPAHLELRDRAGQLDRLRLEPGPRTGLRRLRSRRRRVQPGRSARSSCSAWRAACRTWAPCCRSERRVGVSCR